MAARLVIARETPSMAEESRDFSHSNFITASFLRTFFSKKVRKETLIYLLERRMFYTALLFPQQWYLFGVLDAMDFKKVEQKQETFIVVVVGAVKTVEN